MTLDARPAEPALLGTSPEGHTGSQPAWSVDGRWLFGVTSRWRPGLGDHWVIRANPQVGGGEIRELPFAVLDPSGAIPQVVARWPVDPP